MDTREAITTLTAAGRRKEVEVLLRETSKRAEKAYQPIQSDDSLSDKGRHQRLAATYLQFQRGVAGQLEKMADQVVKTDRDDAQRVFGVHGLPGDPASLSISRRDARDRVAGITSADELADLLKSATRSGDEVLARAVAERAMGMQTQQAAAVLNKFTADRPALDAPVERLWNAERAVNETLFTTMLLNDMKPAELQGMPSHRIDAIAQPEPEPEPAARVFQQPGAFVDQPAGFVQGEY